MRHLDNDVNEDTEPDPVDLRCFYDRLDHRCGQDNNRDAYKKILRYRLASNFGSYLGKSFGPLFRSKKTPSRWFLTLCKILDLNLVNTA